MKILLAWKKKPLQGLLAIITIATIPVLLSAIFLGQIDNWKTIILTKPVNLIMAIILTLTFGTFVALYYYNKAFAPACCAAPGSKAGFAGGATGALIGKCPACFSLFAFILPALGIGSALSVTLFFARWAWLIMLTSTLFVVYSIYKMEGFVSVKNIRI